MGPIGAQPTTTNQERKGVYYAQGGYQMYNVACMRYSQPSACIHTSVITSTPIKTDDLDNEEPLDLRIRIKDTPTKTVLINRESLLDEMTWEESQTSEQHSKAKHPMAMRSRKRLKLSQYYDYQEYSDFGEDLSFLFEEQLPDLEIRPRRNKSKKKKAMTNIKRNLPQGQSLKKDDVITPEKPTSPISHPSHAKDPTSLSDDFSTIRPNHKATRVYPNLTQNCNNFETSEADNNAGTCPQQTVTKRRFNDNCSSNSAKILKRRASQPDINYDSSVTKKLRRSSVSGGEHAFKYLHGNKRLRRRKSLAAESMPKLNFEDGKNLDKMHRLKCVVPKLDVTRKARQKNVEKHEGRGEKQDKNFTVSKMILRRRHSSPLLVDFWEGSGSATNKEAVCRTNSSPSRGTDRRSDNSEKTNMSATPPVTLVDPNDSFCCDDVSDSEQFVDSPDSGFGSESSCSAASPGGDPTNSFFYSPSKSVDVMVEADSDVMKDPVSRSESTDSGIHVTCDISLSRHNDGQTAGKSRKRQEEGEGLRLNLCQESVKEAQRLEEEERKRADEESLRQKYKCQWEGCASPFENRSVSDLHQHLQTCHVEKKKSEQYSCKWQGCKMFDKVSRKLAWIQRHVGEHSGEKPFKCILDGCDASFSSLCSRKRHVEAHYSEVTLPKARVGGEHGAYPRFLLNSRRVRDKRKTLANRHDCMDNRTLCFIKHSLIQNEIATTTDVDGDSTEVLFKAEIVGRRFESDGSKSVLVTWEPPDMLPDQWLPENNFEPEKRVKRCWLPWRAKSSLKKLFFFGKNSNGRKTTSARRTSLIKSLF